MINTPSLTDTPYSVTLLYPESGQLQRIHSYCAWCYCRRDVVTQTLSASIRVGVERATRRCTNSAASWVVALSARVRRRARQWSSRSAPVTAWPTTARVTCDDTPVSRGNRFMLDISASAVSSVYYDNLSDLRQRRRLWDRARSFLYLHECLCAKQ